MDIKSLADRLAELEDPGGVGRKMRQMERSLDPLRGARQAALGVTDHMRGAAERAHLQAVGGSATEMAWRTSALDAMEERMQAHSAASLAAKMAAGLATDLAPRVAAAAYLGPSSAWQVAQQEMASVSAALRRGDIAAFEGARLTAQDATRSAALRASSLLADDLRAYAGVSGAQMAALAEAQHIWQAAADYAMGFRLPGLDEAQRLYADAVRGPDFAGTIGQLTSAAEATRAFSEMSRPWLHEADPARSVRGFIELQAVGRLLSASMPFSVEASAAYRSVLGDWRDTVPVGSAIIADLEARAELYRSRGFDGALTDMPADAFAESIKVTRVSTERPALIAIFAPPVEPSGDEAEEAAFERTNKAHDWLQRFETQVRRFIDERMQAAFGESWPKHRLPNGMYDRWLEKRSAAGARATAAPIVAFADFTDYLAIISRRDNWREVFAQYFERAEAVREAFQRLYPIRIDTMHSRMITADDELFLYVEVRRIVQAITRH